MESPNDPTPEDYKKDIDKVRDFVAKNGMTWPMARQKSIFEIATRRFAIHAYPTAILLDPEGKIAALEGLHGAELLSTLEKLLAVPCRRKAGTVEPGHPRPQPERR